MVETELTISIDKIFRRAGYKQKKAPAKRLKKIIKECITKSRPLLFPYYKFRFYDFKIKKDSLIVGGKYIIKNKFLAGRFDDKKKICLFILTIGPKIENTSNELFQKGELLRGYIFDCIGSEAAETLAQKLNRELEGKIGYKLARYSPGYRNWGLNDQRMIFKLLKPSKIKLNSALQMIPRKSISGIMGSVKKG